MAMAGMEKQLEVFRSGQESAQAEVAALELVLEELRAETAARIKEQEEAIEAERAKRTSELEREVDSKVITCQHVC